MQNLEELDILMVVGEIDHTLGYPAPDAMKHPKDYFGKKEPF